MNVQIIQRCPFTGDPATGVTLGVPRGPDANEVGWKETVRMNPGEVTTVVAKFDLPKVPFPIHPSARDSINGNEYVWHCHILEHEEHDMMRPLVVVGPSPLAVVPEVETIRKDEKAVFTIVNGVPPYRITSSDRKAPPHPARVQKNGGTFTAQPDRTTTYTITDHVGTQVTAIVIVKGDDHDHDHDHDHGHDHGHDNGHDNDTATATATTTTPTTTAAGRQGTENVTERRGGPLAPPPRRPACMGLPSGPPDVTS